MCVPAQMIKLTALDGLSTCVRTCVCGNPRRTSRHSQGPQYVRAHMCACNSIAHARRRCVRRPDDRAPMVVSVCPSLPVAWSPLTSSLLFEMRGSVRPLAGMPWLLSCDTPCSGVFCRVPGVFVPVSFPFRGGFAVFSTRRWTLVFAMVFAGSGVAWFAWVRVLV